MKNYEVKPEEKDKNEQQAKTKPNKKQEDLWGRRQARKEPVRIKNQITVPHK